MYYEFHLDPSGRICSTCIASANEPARRDPKQRRIVIPYLEWERMPATNEYDTLIIKLRVPVTMPSIPVAHPRLVAEWEE